MEHTGLTESCMKTSLLINLGGLSWTSTLVKFIREKGVPLNKGPLPIVRLSLSLGNILKRVNWTLGYTLEPVSLSPVSKSALSTRPITLYTVFSSKILLKTL